MPDNNQEKTRGHWGGTRSTKVYD